MNPPLHLTRVTGFGRGKKESFSQESLQLGSDPACDLRFDPTWDKTVSPRHCTLHWREGELWLEDKSRDGCWLNGRKISRERLAPGSVFELGKGGPQVRVEFEPAERPAAPAAAARPVEESFARPSVPPRQEAAAAAPPPGSAGVSRKPAIPKPVLVALGLVGLLAMAALLFWMTPKEKGDSDALLAEAARLYEKAVGLVVLVLETEEGQRSIPIATAWAVGPNVFATNAHVAEPVRQALEQGGTAFIVINRHPEIRHRVTKAVAHPRFGEPLVNLEGRPAAISPYDVGLLYVDARLSTVFKLAPASSLEKLDSGSRIAYLGFPMEGMAGGGVDFRNPVATMQSGILTAATDFWLSKAEFKDRLLLQHNLGATGGASGSPIFNTRGEVVGLLCAGNIIGQIDMQTGNTQRAPSAVMVNFAQRISLLREIYPEYPKD